MAHDQLRVVDYKRLLHDDTTELNRLGLLIVPGDLARIVLDSLRITSSPIHSELRSRYEAKGRQELAFGLPDEARFVIGSLRCAARTLYSHENTPAPARDRMAYLTRGLRGALGEAMLEHPRSDELQELRDQVTALSAHQQLRLPGETS